jgi:plastocyanin
LKNYRRTINITGWFLVMIGALTIMNLILFSCGGGGGGGYGGGTPVYYSITGQVTSNGTGLAGVTMTLSGAGSATTTTDTNGNFTFSTLSNGSYIVTPSNTGFTFAPMNSSKTVNSANITGVDFTATVNTNPTFSISGTVTSGGIGLAGVTMTLSGTGSATATTDTNGNYTFSTLLNGNYIVTPSKTGFTFAPINSPQTVNSANITGVNFTATAALTVQLVACPGSGTTPVTIQDFNFSPSSVTVSANAIVQWTNNGPSTHTVTSTTVPVNGSFDSSNISPGTSVCFKFTAAGTYNYHCSIHNTMTGVVTVQ